MARLKFGITGDVVGSTGNLTFAVNRGVNYVKKKATEVANPKTTGQRIQRARFTATLRVFQMLSGLLYVGFKNSYAGLSEYSGFMKSNIVPATVVANTDSAAIDYANLLVSKGSLQQTAIGSLHISDGLPIAELTFGTATVGSQESTDVAYGVLYNKTKDLYSISAGDFLRDDGSMTFEQSADFDSGDVCYGYLFFVNPNTNKRSTSVVATTTVA